MLMHAESEPAFGENPAISVIVCAHNPRTDYLSRVIGALKQQSLTTKRWELLLVDNASSPPLKDVWDLTWHPQASHLLEYDVGLTSARLLGINESRGKLLIFVDDDNVIAPNYLEQALQIERDWPVLGAWGGDVAGEFETRPESWTKDYWDYICVRECRDARWSNNPGDWSCVPFGAGLCIRARVASLYAQQLEATPYRRLLDRKGSSLMASGDIDMVLLSRALGLGFGRFPELRMSHLIPARRLTEDYLVELVRCTTCSNVLLNELHPGIPIQINQRRPAALWSFLHLVRHGRRSFRFRKARVKGFRDGKNLREGAV
jgi:glycosyltransferase involved in cell wall biosynthesis